MSDADIAVDQCWRCSADIPATDDDTPLCVTCASELETIAERAEPYVYTVPHD